MSDKKIFRSFLLVLLSLSLLLLFSSCGLFSRDIFYYQESAAKISGTLVIGDTAYGVQLLLEAWNGDADSPFRAGKLTFTEPEELSGVSFEFSAGEVYVTSGEVRIPVSAGSLSSVNLLSCLFCLDRDSVEKIETEKTEDGRETVITVNDGRISASVTLGGKNNLPTRIYAVYGESGFELDIAEMELLETK